MTGRPFQQHGWDGRREDPENRDRSRWYGLRPGDTVEYPTTLQMDGPKIQAVVMRLHSMDNNGCTLKRRGKQFKGVCEWCKIVVKVEDISHD